MYICALKNTKIDFYEYDKSYLLSDSGIEDEKKRTHI